MKYRAKSLLALTMTAVFTAVPAMQAAASRNLHIRRKNGLSLGIT